MLQVHADIDTVKVVVKNVPDYAAGKEKNDLGFLTFDLQVKMQPTFGTTLVSTQPCSKHISWELHLSMVSILEPMCENNSLYLDDGEAFCLHLSKL